MPNRVEKHIKVETYSGYKADERPVRITIDGAMREVAKSRTAGIRRVPHFFACAWPMASATSCGESRRKRSG